MRLAALRVLAGSWAKLELSSSALEMLGLSGRLLIFLMGKRISSMVMVLSLNFDRASISCKVCLPMIRSYNGGGPLLEYLTISGHWCTFFICRIFNKGEFNFTHLLSFEGAIGNAPRFWNNPTYNKYVLI
jgi:hypothetical protein